MKMIYERKVFTLKLCNHSANTKIAAPETVQYDKLRTATNLSVMGYQRQERTCSLLVGSFPSDNSSNLSQDPSHHDLHSFRREHLKPCLLPLETMKLITLISTLAVAAGFAPGFVGRQASPLFADLISGTVKW